MLTSEQDFSMEAVEETLVNTLEVMTTLELGPGGSDPDPL